MKVPVLDAPRVSTRPVATPYSNLNHDTGMGDVAQGLGNLGKGIGDAANSIEKAQAKARKEAEDFRHDAADLEFGRELNRGLYDKNVGFLNQQGERALNEQPTLEGFEKARERITKALPNEELKRRFGLTSQKRIEQAWPTIEKHAAGQRMKVYEGVAKGQVGLALESIGQSYADPNAVDSAIGKVFVGPDGEQGPLRRYLMSQGLPMEQVKAQEDAFRAEAYGTALQGYINARDAEGAEKYFNRVKSQLGPKAAKFAETIEIERTKQQVAGAAQSAVAGSMDGGGWVDPTKARAEVAKLPPGVREKVSEQAERLINQEQERKKLTVEKHYNSALADYRKAGSINGVSATDEQFLKNKLNDPAAWERLLSKARGDAAYYRRIKSGARGDDADQLDALRELQLDMANNPERYRDMSSEAFNEEWGHKLSPAGEKTGGAALAGLQKRAVDAEKKGTLVEDAEFKDATDAVAARSGITSKKELGAFRLHMEGWLTDWRSKNGEKRPPRAEVDKAIADALVEGRIEKAWLPDTKTRRFKAKPGEKFYTGEDPPEEAAATAPESAPAKAPKLKPGRYKDKKTGKAVIVDEQGNKRFE